MILCTAQKLEQVHNAKEDTAAIYTNPLSHRQGN